MRTLAFDKASRPQWDLAECNMFWTDLALDTIWTAAAAKSLQLCLTLCDAMDGSPPGCSVPGILRGVGCHFLLPFEQQYLKVNMCTNRIRMESLEGGYWAEEMSEQGALRRIEIELERQHLWWIWIWEEERKQDCGQNSVIKGVSLGMGRSKYTT